jgi:hypothetical protein
MLTIAWRAISKSGYRAHDLVGEPDSTSPDHASEL